MKKNEINSLLRNYVHSNLSPTQDDISFVSKIYKSFNELLGEKNCIQIGSFPRYTAIKPIHDLDILYIFGNWNNLRSIPDHFMETLFNRIKFHYKNPTDYILKFSAQTHSISIQYMDGEDEVFAVDLVPALINGKNEFDSDTYYVPEIIKYSRGQKRAKFYASHNPSNIDWIKTDPRGYIEIASRLNKKNKDFRKSVKFAKGWKNSFKELNENFKLKSFHLEQLITEDYKSNSHLEIFDSLFLFFTRLKNDIKKPILNDRANSTRYIDQYLTDLTDDQDKLIHQAIDSILIAFENYNENTKNEDIISNSFYKRESETEEFLFDQGIPTFTEKNLDFEIDGFIQYRDGYRSYTASLKKSSGIVDTKNQIDFRTTQNNTSANVIKWKVQNSKDSPSPRGEITNNKTYQKPENTAYIGNHYVEAYAIKNEICVAKDRVNVIIKA